jgi:hypothetical protein
VQFKINGKWHTWIDYDKFHELVSSGRDFKTEDYMAPTPDWATIGLSLSLSSVGLCVCVCVCLD